MEILREYTPGVEQYSIDEAFLDMTVTKEQREKSCEGRQSRYGAGSAGSWASQSMSGYRKINLLAKMASD